MHTNIVIYISINYIGHEKRFDPSTPPYIKLILLTASIQLSWYFFCYYVDYVDKICLTINNSLYKT